MAESGHLGRVEAPVSRELPAAPREVATEAQRRDRLLSALTLTGGAGLLLALPFALRAGAEFFLPVTAAFVIAIALVPLLEWFERRGLPSGLAALLCVGLFLLLANGALAAIVVPATEWVQVLPERITRVRLTLEPLLDLYAALERFIDDVIGQFAAGSGGAARTVQLETPNSLVDLVASSAPHAVIQLFFALLVIYFFLAGWTAMRKRTIVSRGSFSGAMTTARVIQQVVDATSTYLGTITFINMALGAAVAGVLYALDMPSPLMWGGLVAVLNYVPYLGPIVAALLLGLGGLMTFDDVWLALIPAAVFVGLHIVEANVVTPWTVGKRLTINPLMILLSLSFWGWVWGTTGALLAVPLLIIIRTVVAAAGKPDIAGFLFEEGVLTQAGADEPDEALSGPQAHRAG